MKTIKQLIIGIVILTLHSCSSKITTTVSVALPPLEYNKEVKVIQLYQLAPNNAGVVGKVKIGDSGFSTDCDYYVVTELAKLEARKMGGNAIKITEHKYPSVMGSSCHRIKADVLFIKDIESLDVESLPESSGLAHMVAQSYEEDIIIRTNGQKVKCVITEEDDNFVYFNILVNEDLIQTKLSRDQIKSIVYSKKTAK